MKKFLYMIIASSMLCACSEEAEQIVSAKKGVELTMSATIGKPAETRTTYTRQTSGMTVDWEADEEITLVSFGESGITAVDNFTSSGPAGRKKAEFTGTWHGNPGDKVICLYPALSTAAGTTLFDNVTAGSTSINVNFPEHALTTDISKIKNWDIMIGSVSINEGTAHVTLDKKTAVLEFVLSGGYPYDYGVYGKYIIKVGVSAYSGTTPTLFAKTASLAVTKSTYTGDIVPATYYQDNYKQNLDPQLTTSNGTYYFPVLADGTLSAGDQIRLYYDYKEYSGSSWQNPNNNENKTLSAPFTVTPGKIYKITGVVL